jgi:hypothetical protein
MSEKDNIKDLFQQKLNNFEVPAPANNRRKITFFLLKQKLALFAFLLLGLLSISLLLLWNSNSKIENTKFSLAKQDSIVQMNLNLIRTQDPSILSDTLQKLNSLNIYNQKNTRNVGDDSTFSIIQNNNPGNPKHQKTDLIANNQQPKKYYSRATMPLEMGMTPSSRNKVVNKNIEKTKVPDTINPKGIANTANDFSEYDFQTIHIENSEFATAHIFDSFEFPLYDTLSFKTLPQLTRIMGWSLNINYGKSFLGKNSVSNEFGVGFTLHHQVLNIGTGLQINDYNIQYEFTNRIDSISITSTTETTIDSNLVIASIDSIGENSANQTIFDTTYTTTYDTSSTQVYDTTRYSSNKNVQQRIEVRYLSIPLRFEKQFHFNRHSFLAGLNLQMNFLQTARNVGGNNESTNKIEATKFFINYGGQLGYQYLILPQWKIGAIYQFQTSQKGILKDRTFSSNYFGINATYIIK